MSCSFYSAFLFLLDCQRLPAVCNCLRLLSITVTNVENDSLKALCKVLNYMRRKGSTVTELHEPQPRPEITPSPKEGTHCKALTVVAFICTATPK